MTKNKLTSKMKYPKYLEQHLEEIKSIISKWAVEKSLNEVMSWILQFESNDYDIALRILRNFNVVGSDDLNAALQIAYSKLLRHSTMKGNTIDKNNTIYMAIGADGKSGAMIAYNFRMINKLSSARFLSAGNIELINDDKIKNVVLVDDIIASGDQSSEQVKDIAEKLLNFGIENIYVVSAFGFKKGIEKVSNTGVVDVFSAVEYNDCDTIESMDSIFYDGLPYDKRKKYKEELHKSYNGKSYGDIGALISFYYNTPNCSIGTVWKTDGGWIPLFPRMFDAKGNSPELYELDKLIKQTKEDSNTDTPKKNDCAIYVESKVMELFFREVAKRYNNFDYSKLSIVSIGPFYSKDLIASLKTLATTSKFVTNESSDSQTQHAQNINKAVDKSDLVRIKDVMAYFDLKKIRASEKFSRILDSSIFEEDVPEEMRCSLLGIKLFKSQYRVENMQELMENCTEEENIKELVVMFRKEQTSIGVLEQ